MFRLWPALLTSCCNPDSLQKGFATKPCRQKRHWPDILGKPQVSLHCAHLHPATLPTKVGLASCPCRGVASFALVKGHRPAVTVWNHVKQACTATKGYPSQPLKTPKPELISISCRLCATLKSIPALCGPHVRTHRKLPKPTHQGYNWVTGQISEFVGIAQVGVHCQVRHTIPKLEFEFSVSASWRYWNRFERGRINYDWSRTKVHSSADNGQLESTATSFLPRFQPSSWSRAQENRSCSWEGGSLVYLCWLIIVPYAACCCFRDFCGKAACRRMASSYFAHPRTMLSF